MGRAAEGRASSSHFAGGVLALAVTAGLTAAINARACPLPQEPPTPPQGESRVQQRIEQAGVQLEWRALPSPLAVGRPFGLHLRVCPAAAQVLRVDATMPEHRHGMNYRPSVAALGEGQWRAEGLLWHMAGRWELAIEVEHAGQRVWLRQSVTLR